MLQMEPKEGSNGFKMEAKCSQKVIQMVQKWPQNKGRRTGVSLLNKIMYEYLRTLYPKIT